MPKEKPLQGGGPLRGGDTSTIAEAAYSGKIPLSAFAAIERELTGLVYGTASIVFHVRAGKLARCEIEKCMSYLPEEPVRGSDGKEE
jgi:hypothetical protein